MRVGTNISALTANNALKRTDTALSKSMEKLSSGLKVNHAKDNPAGIAIAKRMNSQINGLSIAGDNAADAISVIETADGALTEIHSILQRMNELAVQGANGTMSDGDRATIDAEIQQLKEEIGRISKTTDFNGKTLLDGTFDLKGYSSDSRVKVAYYSDEVEIGEYKLNIRTLGKDADGNVRIPNKNYIKLTDSNGKNVPIDHYEVNGNMLTLNSDSGFEIKLEGHEKTVRKDGRRNTRLDRPPSSAAMVRARFR